MSSNPLLYPNVAGAPGGVPLTKDPAQAPEARGVPQNTGDQTADFKKILGDNFSSTVADASKSAAESGVGTSNGIKAPLKFSAHASARVQSRGIDMGSEQMRKLGDAVDKAAAKGLDDTLILMKDAAFIVSVKNRTVVTVMDRSQLEGNVFTNIDGAVIV